MELYNNYQSQFSINSIVENLQVNIDLFREELSRVQLEETNIEKENICITKSFINEKHLKLKKLRNKSSLKSNIPSHTIQNLLKRLKKSYKEKNEETSKIICRINNELNM